MQIYRSFLSLVNSLIQAISRRRYATVAVQIVLGVYMGIGLPITGHCKDENGWFNNLLLSKGKNMSNVASKVAELPEKQTFIVRGLDFSPNGELVAVVSNAQVIRIWDWKNDRIVHSIQKAVAAYAGATTEPIRFSPDGRWFVACHRQAVKDVVIQIWNTETWELAHDITDAIYGGCNAIGFTPDGKFLIRAAGRNPLHPADELIVYSAVDWKPSWSLPTSAFQPSALAVSPDGKHVALGGSFLSESKVFKPQILIVDMEQRAVVRTIPDTIDFYFGQLAWSPDGTQLAAIGKRAWDSSATAYIGGPDTTMVFDARSGKQVAGEQWPKGDLSSLRYTPDGKYLIEGNGNGSDTGLGVRIWDGQHRELLQEIPGNVGSLAVSMDGRYLAVGSTKKTTVWQLK